MGQLRCPECGAKNTWAAWENDAACAKAFKLRDSLPIYIQPMIPLYIGLFRQGKRCLPWVKIARIMEDLAAIVKADTLSWDGEEPRVVTAEIWYAAFNAVLNRRPDKLNNHNFLRHTAYNLADPRKKTFAVPVPGSVNLGTSPGTAGRDKPQKIDDQTAQRNIEKAKEIAERFSRPAASTVSTPAESRLDDLARGKLKGLNDLKGPGQPRTETPADRERKALQEMEAKRMRMKQAIEEENSDG